MKLSKRLQGTLATFVTSLVLGAGVVTLAPVQQAAAEVPAIRKIAVVDMQRVLNETKQGKSARNRLESSTKKKQKKLDAKRTKLESDSAAAQSLGGQELAAAQEKLQRDYMELQNMYMTLQQELAGQEAKLLEKMLGNSKGIAKELAGKHGVDLVLIRDPATVLYTKASLDLTSEVIRMYDVKYPK
ncbi:MAG: OmpH family outer membrane protein [Nannocystaceae bacterium]